ncbi:MAG TPA: FTR1 family protein [Stellaceae bacterium]|nr:FTR1 family protein [Stellaceae bacterium]
MLGSALIVFRETLEAALIVAIVLGATRGVAGRGRWVGMGILGGIAGALVVAGFAGAIAEAVEGRGQALLNAAILIAAVCMLAWHNTWMSAHGREISARMKQVGHEVSVGAKPLSALALVTLFAVLREGSETVLFLYGLASSGAGAASLVGGAALGLLAGVGLGAVLYRGLLIIPAGQFLNVVGWLVLLLAAGLAANAAMFLNQAGLVPALVPQVWNTSWLLAQQSWLGTLLHILVGYSDRPSGIEVVFYLVTVATILGLMRTVGRPPARPIGSVKQAP